MRKILTVLIATAMALSLCACSSTAKENADNSSASASTSTNSASSVKLESTYVDIDGIYVDDSYKDKKSDALKLVYVFYTVHTSDKNIEAYSKDLKMAIGSNEYTSSHYGKACQYMPNYYYSNYIKKVYVGEEFKVVDTFAVPEGDLTEGKEIVLSATRYPDLETITLSTSDIKHSSSQENIATDIDPEGFALALKAFDPADEETAAPVQSALNGDRWDFYVNKTSYRIEFFEPNIFELQKPIRNAGTYEVFNGYVHLTYDSNGATVDIPYGWKDDGDIDLKIADGFDIAEN